MARRIEECRDIAEIAANLRWQSNRIDSHDRWRDILPAATVAKQIDYERRHAALRMHLLGLAATAIADRLGISVRRAATLIANAKRDVAAEMVSPAETYLRDAPELDRLAFLLRDPASINVRILPPLRPGKRPFPRRRQGR